MQSHLSYWAAVFLAVLLPANATGVDVALRHPVGNLYFEAAWEPSRDFSATIPVAEGTELRIRASRRRAAVVYVADGQLTDWRRVWFAGDQLPNQPQACAPFVIKFRSDGWTFYCQNRAFLRIGPPASPITVQLPEDGLIIDSESVRFQKLAPMRFADDFTVSDALADLAQWSRESGAWRVYSQQETAVAMKAAPAAKLAKQPLEPDRSPNLYSLTGHVNDEGTEAVLTSGYRFSDDYSAQVSVQLGRRDAGLVVYYRSMADFYAFTIRAADGGANRAVATLWRRQSDASAAGYVLGAVSIPVTTSQWLLLRVEASGQRLRAFVDGTPIIDVSEALGVGGQFGLYSASHQTQRFDDFSMASLQNLTLDDEQMIRFHTLVNSRGLQRLQRASETGTIAVDRGPEAGWFIVGAVDHMPHSWSARFHSPLGTVGLITGYRGEAHPYFRFVRYRREHREHYRLEAVRPTSVTVIDEWTLIDGESVDDEPVTLTADTSIDGLLRLYRNRVMVGLHQITSEAAAGASGLYFGPNSSAAISDLRYRFESKSELGDRDEKNRHFIADPYMRHWSSPEGSWLTDHDGNAWHKSDFFGPFVIEMPVRERSDVHLGITDGDSTGPLSLAIRGDQLILYQPDQKQAAIVPATLPIVPLPPVGAESTVDADTKQAPKTEQTQSESDGPHGAATKGYHLHYDGREAWMSFNGNVLVRHRLVRPLGHPPKTIPESGMAERNDDDDTSDSAPSTYRLHYDGYWVWVSVGREIVLTHRLNAPLSGSRMRVVGFSQDDFAHSRVHRSEVTDFLFNQSPHQWVLNGGVWHVINRFQCDPRWSHLNGENGVGLAAMWSKYRYGGDFCVELYAGMKHEWYDRCGDINITMMNERNTASRGYTVTCAGWDFNESQLWNTFYRNAEIVARNDMYTLPRLRAGNKRTWTNPLGRGGRPVHGAWYYIKLRRIGNHLEYYFDNQKIAEYTDDQPLNGGTFGLWTFLNSIMIARIKIAADTIERVPVVTMPAAFVVPPAIVVSPDDTATPPQRQQNGEDAWFADDDVSRAELAWHTDRSGRRYFVATNVLGAGTFLTKRQQSPLPYRSIAGFHFYVKRTKNAQFNFHYSIGTRDQAGTFHPSHHYYHQLAGTDFSRGTYRRYGYTNVAGIDTFDQHWHQQGAFQAVTVWLPTTDHAAADVVAPLWVRIDGFGNLQPSDVLAGLTGNGTGDAYAIADFTPIYQEPPDFQSHAASVREIWRTTPDGQRVPLTVHDDDVIQRRCSSLVEPGLYTAILRTPQSAPPAVNSSLVWLNVSARPVVTCNWASNQPDTVVFRAAHAYPDRRLARARVWINQEPGELYESALGEWACRLPRSSAVTQATEPLSVTLTVPSLNPTLQRARNAAARGELKPEVYHFALSWPERAHNEPPVLMALDGVPFFLNFETRQLGQPLTVDPRRMRLAYHNGPWGTSLQVSNDERKQRLASTFAVPFSNAAFPLLQFRYRAEELAHVTLRFGKRYSVKLSENRRAVTVRHGVPPVTDGEWHTWTGRISDAYHKRPFSPDFFVPSAMTFSSFAHNDQTGKYSRWWLDDIVFGPAVSETTPIVVTPHYFDHDGVNTVHWAIHAGEMAYDPLTAEIDRVRWQPALNGQPIEPDLGALSDGVHHLLLRATDTMGNRSVSTDIPFLLDRKPLVSTYRFSRSTSAYGNGTQLDLSFKSGGTAPLAIDTLVYTINGEPVSFDDYLSRISHQPKKDVITLNWPYLFRHRLDRMADGESVELVVSNIMDGAGNRSPDVSVPFVHDFEQDRIGPAWLSPQFGHTVFWTTSWEGRPDKPLYFKVGQHNGGAVYEQFWRETHFDHRCYKGKGWIAAGVEKWQPAVHPYLSFNIRVAKLDEGRLTLKFVLSDDREHTVVLRDPSASEGDVTLPRPIDWKADVWHAVTINVREMLREEFGSSSIKMIRWDRTKTAPNAQTKIRNVFIHSPWTRGDMITVDAYDASGISAFNWEYINGAGEVLKGGTVTQRQIEPAALDLPFVDDGWLLFYAVDQAGAISAPLRVACAR